MHHELHGKKVLVMAGPMFEDHELIYPNLRMREAGAEVKIAGLGEKEYKGKHGVPVDVDGSCQDFKNEAWDAVIIPGGYAPDKIRLDQAALEIVRKANQRGAVVAAICHAGWVLASADIIRGRAVTSYIALKDDMVNAGGIWEDAEVVVDKNLITSRMPDDLPAFCQAIIKTLRGEAVNEGASQHEAAACAV